MRSAFGGGVVCLLRGVCLLGGLPSEGSAYPWYCGKADLPVGRMTVASENITLPILHMQVVKKLSLWKKIQDLAAIKFVNINLWRQVGIGSF